MHHHEALYLQEAHDFTKTQKLLILLTSRAGGIVDNVMQSWYGVYVIFEPDIVEGGTVTGNLTFTVLPNLLLQMHRWKGATVFFLYEKTCGGGVE